MLLCQWSISIKMNWDLDKSLFNLNLHENYILFVANCRCYADSVTSVTKYYNEYKTSWQHDHVVCSDFHETLIN